MAPPHSPHSDIGRQFIWGLRYVDDLIRRDRYSSGAINETRFAMQDANFNLTAITDETGALLERVLLLMELEFPVAGLA
jgi:hypothetical protein